LVKAVDPRAVAIAVETETAMGWSRPVPYHLQPIEYIDMAPRQIEVQIPLVEYFERIKRLKADKWQQHFCNYLQEAVVNRHVKPTWAEFHAQAQLGKTVVLSQVFKSWCFGHDPLWRATLAMYNISRSVAHSEVIIQIMRSRTHTDIFPDKDGHLPQTVSKDGWSTNARLDVEQGRVDGQKSFNPVGLLSGMTGSGFDDLTIDDPYKEPGDAFSETIYQNLERFWSYGVNPRLSSYACIFAMFHRYSYDDFGGYLLNTGKFDYVRYASIADGAYYHDETGQKFDDPLGRADGEYISERFGDSYYADKRQDSKVWLSMFQGRPGKEEGEFFQVDKIQDVSEHDVEREWNACILKGRGWDHAATQGAGDRSAGGLIGIQANGDIIIKDVFSDQLDTAARSAKQREIAEQDGRDVTIVIPEERAASGKDVVFFTQQLLQGFHVIPRPVTNSAPGSNAKMRRAHNLSVVVNSGKVKMFPGAWRERLKRLMRRFGAATSGDDEIDALSDVFNVLNEEYYKGLVIKGYTKRNDVTQEQITEKFKCEKFLEQCTIYAGVSITGDATRANSAILVARAPANWWMPETLFVLERTRRRNFKSSRCAW
jgi:phage terminase large subunit-like protein